MANVSRISSFALSVVAFLLQFHFGGVVGQPHVPHGPVPRGPPPRTVPKTFVVGGYKFWDYNVTNYAAWAKSNGPFYVGDTLLFFYSSPSRSTPKSPLISHNVVQVRDIAAFKACQTKIGAFLIGNSQQGSKATGVAHILKTPGWHLFSSQGRNDCRLGKMKLAIKVRRRPRTLVVGGFNRWNVFVDFETWVKEVSPVYVGDRFVFYYSPPYIFQGERHNHNVVRLQTARDLATCAVKKGTVLAGGNTGSTDTGFVYTFTKPGPYYFACGWPGHCQITGMALSVNVFP